MKVKAEARLDLLRQAGVAVETWLKSAMNQVMEELENERWNNLSTHDPSLSVRPTSVSFIDYISALRILMTFVFDVRSVCREQLIWSTRMRRRPRTAAKF